MAGITLPVGDEDEPGISRCDAALLKRLQDLVGETIDEQRVRRDRRNRDGSRPRRAGAAPRQLLAQHRPLPDIQVERGRQHEED